MFGISDLTLADPSDQMISVCQNGSPDAIKQMVSTTPQIPIALDALWRLMLRDEIELLEWIMNERPEIDDMIKNGAIWQWINHSAPVISGTPSAETLIWALEATSDPREQHQIEAFRYSCRQMDLPSARVIWGHLHEQIVQNHCVMEKEFIRAHFHELTPMADALEEMIGHCYNYRRIACSIAKACILAQWEIVKAAFDRYPRLSNTSTPSLVAKSILDFRDTTMEIKYDTIVKLHEVWSYLETDKARTSVMSEILKAGHEQLMDWLLVRHNGEMPNPPNAYDTRIRQSFLTKACRGPSLALAMRIWNGALNKEALYPIYAYIVARMHGRMENAEWLMQIYPEINPSFEIDEQLLGASKSGSIEMIQRLIQLCPDAVTPEIAQRMFCSACFGNSLKVAEYLLKQYDTITIEKNHHRLFANMTSERRPSRWSDTLELIMNRSIGQDYRYLKYGKSYYLINVRWDSYYTKSVHLIHGIYVCSTSAVSLRQATECLESIRMQKSARTALE